MDAIEEFKKLAEEYGYECVVEEEPEGTLLTAGYNTRLGSLRVTAWTGDNQVAAHESYYFTGGETRYEADEITLETLREGFEAIRESLYP